MTLNPILIWFLLGLALILVEFMLPGIILVFFGGGAWIVAMTTWLGLTDSLWSQLLLFAVASILLLLCLRRWVRSQFLGFMSSEQDPTVDLDDFTGREVKVVQPITPGSRDGRVEFKGAEWLAVADQPLAEGKLVKILAVDGITLKVAAITEEEES
jgi:membrane protein implicated in regulation of membrane protease activity